MESKHFMGLGAILAGCSVATGAFGAHMLKEALSPQMLSAFETAVRYQMYHSLALLLSGWVLTVYQRPVFKKAAWFFLFGLILFSGSLYAISLLDVRWLGPVTPIGGVSFICGWGCLALGFLRKSGPVDSL